MWWCNLVRICTEVPNLLPWAIWFLNYLWTCVDPYSVNILLCQGVRWDKKGKVHNDGEKPNFLKNGIEIFTGITLNKLFKLKSMLCLKENVKWHTRQNRLPEKDGTLKTHIYFHYLLRPEEYDNKEISLI